MIRPQHTTIGFPRAITRHRPNGPRRHLRGPAILMQVGVMCLAAAGCTGAPAVPSTPSTSGVMAPASLAAQVERASELVGDVAERGVGLSVAVAREGRVVWSEAHGYADLADRTVATPASLFRLYSVSKPMTAAAAARLMEAGRITPSNPVRDYVPSFRSNGDPITVMQVATHTSGIRHYSDDAEAAGTRHCFEVADALPIFSDDPLVHAPGAGEAYSSWGYVLLSAVIEAAAGTSYTEAMRSLVFDPAGLESMAIDDPTVTVPRRASFYREVEPGRFAPADPVDNTCKWGAGAWLGTAADVARFGSALVGERLLSAQTRQLFLRGQSAYRAQGIGTGGMAFMVADAEHGLSIALLSNAVGETLGPELQELTAEMHRLFTGGNP